MLFAKRSSKVYATVNIDRTLNGSNTYAKTLFHSSHLAIASYFLESAGALLRNISRARGILFDQGKKRFYSPLV